MTGILDLIRNSTPETVAAATGGFDTPRMPARRAPKNMVRIVKGADDLTPPARTGTGTRKYEDFTTPQHNDGRSPRQIETMDSLLEQIKALDEATWEQAVAYTSGMTENGKWTPGREGTASVWIGRMITKVRALRDAARVQVVSTPNEDDKFQDIPNGYYAVGDAGPDDIHFFRVSRFRDGGIKVQEQASDTLHPVRRGGRRTAILTTIKTVGWRNSQELYGRTIGRCGRCNRTLTDADSRARGIGPDCWEKM